MVDEVEPGHGMDPYASISALSACNALHVLGELASAVDRLATLDLVDHLAHVHVDFPTVLGEAIEAVCFVIDQLVLCSILCPSCLVVLFPGWGDVSLAIGDACGP